MKIYLIPTKYNVSSKNKCSVPVAISLDKDNSEYQNLSASAIKVLC